ncbi:aminotransferase class IV [Flavobacterium branchiophilum]|uniref:branched-chain-amino-acid transaminase n=1 Tax=Flavobacterium branchiophilum TaxID=55197 RepID=A0A2H3KCD5_9FLAO|nr:aminotransferase class IV [Flavobacterium branchiophilum]PDS25007.1 aminotransferase class IV [Flavobacterium branchiophilum]
MVNSNGNIVASNSELLHQNRAFLYGDAVFETLKIVNHSILFWEDHYFRLMATMRIVRMEIPMNFTMEYLENQILSLVQTKNITNAARARITVYRASPGFYLPETNDVGFVIQVAEIPHSQYQWNSSKYEVDLYKDFYISKQLISNLKTTNKIIHITGSIFAKENDLDNCLLLNESKQVTEALQGNVFVYINQVLKTPPLSEGCLNGVMRKNIISLLQKNQLVPIEESPISPFELQKADEIFITNVVQGIQPITHYRKKTFGNSLAIRLIEMLNNHVQTPSKGV